MIHKRHHNTIAGLLLICTLIMTLPFYGFMHHHSDFISHPPNTETHHNQNLSQLDEHAIESHNCLACSISQVVEQMFFIKSAEFSLVLSATNILFVTKTAQQAYSLTITSPGRSPPTA